MQEAKGPSYARFLQDSLIKNQEFCMQVDAHSDFIQNWFEYSFYYFGLYECMYVCMYVCMHVST